MSVALWITFVSFLSLLPQTYSDSSCKMFFIFSVFCSNWSDRVLLNKSSEQNWHYDRMYPVCLAHNLQRFILKMLLVLVDEQCIMSVADTATDVRVTSSSEVNKTVKLYNRLKEACGRVSSCFYYFCRCVKKWLFTDYDDESRRFNISEWEESNASIKTFIHNLIFDLFEWFANCF